MLFIKNAKYLKDYLISIEFSSGEKGIADFKDIIQKYPAAAPLRDPAKFKAFSICKAIQARDPSATVSLFGSMVDDQAHGGDIDLLVRSKRLTLSDRLDIACELEDALGLRKIDLVIDNGRPNAFVRSIESRAIRL